MGSFGVNPIGMNRISITGLCGPPSSADPGARPGGRLAGTLRGGYSAHPLRGPRRGHSASARTRASCPIARASCWRRCALGVETAGEHGRALEHEGVEGVPGGVVLLLARGHAPTTKRKGTGARRHMPVVHCGGPQLPISNALVFEVDLVA